MAYMELDLGCGRNKHMGAIGLDMNPGVNPDVLFEVDDKKILPFANNTFDRVWMLDFIEHVRDPQWLLSEVHRVSKPNARVEVRYPHYSYRTHSDLTHIHRGFGIRIFEHYDPSTEYGKKYHYNTNYGRNFPFKIESRTARYCLGKSRIPWLLSKILGDSVYEAFISNILPIVEVDTRLRVLKDK